MNHKHIFLITLLGFAFLFQACAQSKVQQNSLTEFPPVITNSAEYNKLTPAESRVILREGTEYAFSGAYHDNKKTGTYLCKQCNLPLFLSADKFDSKTGWPSFDDAIPGAVKEITDADGRRTEIVCSNCEGHLGHVFRGESFTPKSTRHCANSVSLNFVAETLEKAAKGKPRGNTDVMPINEYVEGKGYEQYAVATLAGGCFWCTEASFERIQGVVDVISGYSGGKGSYPTYEKIGTGRTGHAEAIAVYYDPEVVSYETLLEVFFVAHDPTQLNRQGPDVGTQYRSAIFYHDDAQKTAAEKSVKAETAAGHFSRPIVTEIVPYEEFWVAEGYHQDYYVHHPENPYVQRVSKPKVKKVEKKFANLLKPEFQ